MASYPLMPWAMCPWCADSCSACSSSRAQVRLDVEDDLLHGSGEREWRPVRVGAVDYAAVVAADVHARVAGEPERARCGPSGPCRSPCRWRTGDVAAGGGLGRVGVELHPDGDFTGGQRPVSDSACTTDAHHRVGVLSLPSLSTHSAKPPMWSASATITPSAPAVGDHQLGADRVGVVVDPRDHARTRCSARRRR